MWDLLLDLLPVGCRHRHMTLPFSAVSSRSKATIPALHCENVSEEKSGPYVVCLDCGRHFDYDWSRMRIVK